MPKTILIVDDSVSIRESVKHILKSNGFAYIEAVDGMDGLNKAKAGNVDCVITDINMPNLNGLEFIKEIRSHEDLKYLPVLVLTTESEVGMMRKGLSAGATGWVIKPFNDTKLLAALQKLI